MKDVLRFLTCGNVDEGKSTLVGRLLFELGGVYADQMEALKQDSQRHGTQGAELDFALLLDGLIAEREQGITIDVAYRYVSTARRRFIIADSPGHMQYTRNMVTAASTSDLAIVLVDVTRVMGAHTRRHLTLCRMMGIEHFIVVVNKMDLVGYEESTFRKFEAEVADFFQSDKAASVVFIPLSALHGENLRNRSVHMPWYQGRTLVDHLENVVVGNRNEGELILPIQLVARTSSGARALAGRLARGMVQKNSVVRIHPSGQKATVREILTPGEAVDASPTGESVMLTLDRDVDVARGHVMTAQDQVLHVSTQFQATLAWLSETSASAGRQFDLKLSHQWTTATIYKIKHKLNLDTLMPEAAMELRVNEVYKIQFSTTTSLSSLPFADCRELGGFILVDRVTKETVAVGTLDFALRRGETVKPELSYLTGRDREQKFGHRGKVLWFTGLSGAGKSTLANNLERELFGLGIRTMILDGDNLRSGLNKDLGFSEADRIENIRRTAEVAKLMFDAGLVVIVAVISPFNADRAAAKELIGAENFMEVFVATPLDVCERRDPKGLYAKARSGVIPNLTGIGSPYEPPENPALTLDTSRVSLADSIEQLKQLVL